MTVGGAIVASFAFTNWVILHLPYARQVFEGPDMSRPVCCVFNLAALRPSLPIKRQPSAERTQASQSVELPLDPLV
jgi:hypothetical protein